MEDVTCRRCGSINNYSTSTSGKHLRADCKKCGEYIKFLPHEAPKFYFGKYKGSTIREVDDLEYLKWAVKANTLKGRSKEAATIRIEQLENELKKGGKNE